MTELTVIIPSLGRRESLFDIIEQLRDLAAHKPDLNICIIVSFNPKPSWGMQVASPQTGQLLPNLRVEVMLQDRYLPNSEAHLLHLLQWFSAKPHSADSYLWFLTDNDPLLAAGMAAMIELIELEEPDVLFMNNVWGDSKGEMIPALAFPMHARIWTGPAKDLFCGLGFEHAVTNIGVFILRAGFLTPELVSLFQATFEREEVCSHAWWLFEASSRGRLYLHSIPVLVNKMNPHNFDPDPTWREGTDRRKLPWQYPWTVGYLKHLIYYIEKGLLTCDDLRTATISEPQRGILPFMDEIVRRLFLQAEVALTSAQERFSSKETSLVKEIFFRVYPARKALIDALCNTIEAGDTDSASRLAAFETAHDIWRHEQEHGLFAKLFLSSTNGYHIYEHRNGFVAILQKDRIDLGYREIDPIDFEPYLLYGPTEAAIRKKIHECCAEARYTNIIWENYNYFGVSLREPQEKPIRAPQLQVPDRQRAGSLTVWLELELAKFLCTIGSVGTQLWNHAARRGSQR
jgi:hypothetical protein